MLMNPDNIIHLRNTIKNEQECITIGELYERMEQEIDITKM